MPLRLQDDALVIDNLPGHEARYCLLPPESARSEIHMEATLKSGRADPANLPPSCAISQLGVVINVAPDGIWSRRGADFRSAVDMTDYHTITLNSSPRPICAFWSMARP